MGRGCLHDEVRITDIMALPPPSPRPNISALWECTGWAWGWSQGAWILEFPTSC